LIASALIFTVDSNVERKDLGRGERKCAPPLSDSTIFYSARYAESGPRVFCLFLSFHQYKHCRISVDHQYRRGCPVLLFTDHLYLSGEDSSAQERNSQ